MAGYETLAKLEYARGGPCVATVWKNSDGHDLIAAMEDIVLDRREKTRQLLQRIARRPVVCCFCLVASPEHAQRAKRVFRIVRRAKRKGWI